jgi:aromatic ring-opening dioxygenase catalytic subunit (LigB family)
MYNWEERKHIETVLKKRDELRKKELERLQKIKRSEESHQKFKQWLKDSIVKQQREVYLQKLEQHEKKMQDEEKKKLKEENEVMAKIAYKVWKEKKSEEARNVKKLQKMEKRRAQLEAQEAKMARR